MMKEKKQTSFFYWGIFFLLMLLKFGYYGFEYFPVMDDWIQYGTYSLSESPFQEVVLKTQMYTIRPLAGLSDVYIIGKFWDDLSAIFLIITVLHAFSCYFFVRVFEYKKIKTGYIFLLTYGLSPFLTEATYWISASSRLVVSIFFLSVALFFLCKYLYETNKKRYLGLFFIFQLMSLGYYETVILLGFVFVMFLIIPKIKRKEGILAGVVTIVNYYIITAYYNNFSYKGQIMIRGELAEGSSISDYYETLKNIVEMFSNNDIYFYARGFMRGYNIIIEDKAYVFLAIAALLSTIVFFASKQDTIERKFSRNIKKMWLGIILFVSPLILFFIIQFNWVSFRNAFTSFIGLGLILEALFDMGTSNLFLRRTKDVLICFLVFIFLIVNLSEISDFKSVSLADKKIGNEIIKTSEGLGLIEGERKAYVFNARNSYVELNKEYNEHINNITSSEWLITGALRGMSGEVEIKGVLPVFVNKPVYLFPVKYENYIFLGIDNDLSVHVLDYKREGNFIYRLYRQNGTLFGRLEYRYGYAFFSQNRIMR